MSNEEIQILLSEFNRQFDKLREDLNSTIEKMADKIVLLGESNISCAKDIESTREWCNEKIKDIKKDINGIGKTIGLIKEDVIKNVEGKIKTGDLMTRLMIAGSYITGLTALLMLLANKFI